IIFICLFFAFIVILFMRILIPFYVKHFELPLCMKYAINTLALSLPSLPSLPIIGSLLSLVTDRSPHIFQDCPCFFQQLQKKYGDLYSLMMGSHKVLIVNNHHHAKEVLFKKGKIFAGRPRTFHRKMVHGALCMFGEGSSAGRRALCVTSELTCAVTNVVCALCFIPSYKRGDAEFESMLWYSQGIVDTVAKDSLVDIFPWLQTFPNKDLKILRQCVSIRDKLLQKKYEEHKVDYSDNVQRDLLDALLRAKGSSEQQGLALSLAAAGRSVQRKIQQELDNKIGKDRHPQLSNRGNLPYLEATIREVLRIRPVSPLLIPHVVLKDTSVGEYTVQKGTRKEWKNPELFDPGRFLNEEGDGLCCPSASYLPFGAGVRVCLGEALAKMKLFLFLSWILQRFTLEMPAGQPLPDLQGKFGVVLQHKKF
uniref:Cytochrome P450 family 17 subfamily A member 1 n=1 Tax=Sinocyclocheilus rhinocerous TaxID=307959 RepID=A0A673NPG0_9TELE